MTGSIYGHGTHLSCSAVPCSVPCRLPGWAPNVPLFQELRWSSTRKAPPQRWAQSRWRKGRGRREPKRDFNTVALDERETARVQSSPRGASNTPQAGRPKKACRSSVGLTKEPFIRVPPRSQDPVEGQSPLQGIIYVLRSRISAKPASSPEDLRRQASFQRPCFCPQPTSRPGISPGRCSARCDRCVALGRWETGGHGVTGHGVDVRRVKNTGDVRNSSAVCKGKWSDTGSMPDHITHVTM